MPPEPPGGIFLGFTQDCGGKLHMAQCFGHCLPRRMYAGGQQQHRQYRQHKHPDLLHDFFLLWSRLTPVYTRIRKKPVGLGQIGYESTKFRWPYFAKNRAGELSCAIILFLCCSACRVPRRLYVRFRHIKRAAIAANTINAVGFAVLFHRDARANQPHRRVT